jgi:ABC-type lipoprotein release transport system permease subunit
LKGIYRRVGKLVTLGLAIGIVVTFAVKQYFESVVPIHISKDAAYLIALCLILALLGLSAALLPAIHAAKTEPVQALRNE